MSKDNEDLAPLGTWQEGMPWNPVEKVIMERRSVRNRLPSWRYHIASR
ncbi:MAG: hypothetical protein NTW65_11765 [Deltaproteobacteria bacterium]|nr:hypothetical protein [Deltaproteobacteria bacterium]